MTGFVAAGVPQENSYLATAVTWTPSPQPTLGNGLIIPYCIENPLNLLQSSVVITDNAGNSYANQLNVANLHGNGTLGSIVTGFITCQACNYSGTLILTATMSGSGRFSSLLNHIEVNNINVIPDKTGSYTSGAAPVFNATVTGSAANTNANDVVISTLMIFNTLGQFAVASDPPTTGYTSAGYASLAGNSAATLTTTGDIGYKSVVARETSSARWPLSGNWSYDGIAVAAIASFGAAPIIYPIPSAPRQTFVTETILQI